MLLAATVAALGMSAAPPVASGALAQTFRRAEFWDASGAVTLLDIVNVLGRWEDPSDWSTRTLFSSEESAQEVKDNIASTRKRYEMAQRLGQVERVAMVQNVPRLPFRNGPLAEAFGLSVRDFAKLEVKETAVNVVFDVLAQSKNGLLPPDTITARRANLFRPDGGLDLGALTVGLLKARALVILSWFLFGKGNIVGIVILLKVISDTTGLLTADGFQQILERQDALLLVVGTGGLMTYVGQSQEQQEQQRRSDSAKK